MTTKKPQHDCLYLEEWGETKEFKKNIMEKFNNLELEVKTWFKEVKAMLEWLDNKYASKTVERIVYWLAALILTSFITAVCALVFINKINER